ncbi:ABC transporter ATP-binding protein [Mesorhizobium sp. CAU 1741]|uniref:ABC transporter ATP-binding protein n=1 Tax=Mesorhizobium sp. CAU 1741 TaxID=3140366 RepID=UPI00325B3C27
MNVVHISGASGQNRSIVEVRDFTLSFAADASQNLIDGVSFSAHAGRTLCVVGESGCGKSVMSLALMGLLGGTSARVVRGSMSFEGRDLLSMSAHERASLSGGRMAMIFQEPMTSLNPGFTIGNQLVECIRLHRDISVAAARKEALELLRKVGLPATPDRLAVYPHQLSGGQRQRVMIAMAIANRPQLLIADEPTTALDVTIQAQILSLMRDLREEVDAAVILITHDLRVVAEVADDVLVMYAGRVVETGSVADIFDDPQHPYTIGLFGSTPDIGPRHGRLYTIEGAVPALEAMPAGCRFSPRCPFADERCRREVPPLKTFENGHVAACWHAPITADMATLS